VQINQKAAPGRRPSAYVMRPPGDSEHQPNLPTFARLGPRSYEIAFLLKLVGGSPWTLHPRNLQWGKSLAT